MSKAAPLDGFAAAFLMPGETGARVFSAPVSLILPDLLRRSSLSR